MRLLACGPVQEEVAAVVSHGHVKLWLADVFPVLFLSINTCDNFQRCICTWRLKRHSRDREVQLQHKMMYQLPASISIFTVGALASVLMGKNKWLCLSGTTTLVAATAQLFAPYAFLYSEVKTCVFKTGDLAQHFKIA